MLCVGLQCEFKSFFPFSSSAELVPLLSLENNQPSWTETREAAQQFKSCAAENLWTRIGAKMGPIACRFG